MTRSSEELPRLLPPPTGPARRSLAQAVASAVALLVLVAGAYAIGSNALAALVAVVVALAVFELLRAVKRGGGRPVAAFGVAVTAALVVAAYWERAGWLLGALGALVAGSLILALRPTRGARPASDAAWTVMSVLWVGGGGAAAAAILAIDRGGRALLVAFLLVVAATDVAAYFVGSHWGRRKLAPAISPGKSWEGAIAGFVGGLAAGSLAGAAVHELSLIQGLGLGALCGVLAPAGDLVESLAKREIGVKDSGGLLPGHGGFLDRLDAMVFCAAPVLVYLRVLGL